ncbi:RIP metalloprotease RseP [Paenibacillus sp. L3-i20]|uniref:RIP metalloprotease RseP n=1 Tax=Paenibacillus sp. L3-i20 TaxID=2905833 RepID=UPI001EDE796E|nr:RIP metalloprotease RseP [Paenibacillus sp. L3-i20]GKU78664.1 zinc metalloprotease [Paenibacillus sp. L3-i20]
MGTIQVVFMTVLVFFVIVTIHEWGHYYFAKRAGILVREFAIGFGPKLFSLKRGETRFTLRLIPAGGFVRMAGEDPELVEAQPGQTVAVRLKDNLVTRIYLDRLDERAGTIRGEVDSIDLEHKLTISLNVEGEVENYSVHPQALVIAKGKDTQIAPIDRHFGSKPIRKRAMAIFAGPMMNFVLAFVLFGVYAQLVGVPVDNPDKLLVSTIEENYPASKVDLKKGDIVESINGIEIGADLPKMIDIIGKSPNKPIEMKINRDGTSHAVTITPRPNEEGVGKVGIGATLPTRPATAVETVTRSAELMKVSTIFIFENLKMLVTGQFKLDDLGGPVRTAEMTSQIAKKGLAQLTSWTAMLSLYLGIFNLLPVPALDGSRLLFLGLEGIRKRPLDPSKESMVHFVGFAMLMLLMLVVTYNDILRLVRGE